MRLSMRSSCASKLARRATHRSEQRKAAGVGAKALMLASRSLLTQGASIRHRAAELWSFISRDKFRREMAVGSLGTIKPIVGDLGTACDFIEQFGGAFYRPGIDQTTHTR